MGSARFDILLKEKLEELGIDRSESDQWNLRENMEENEDE